VRVSLITLLLASLISAASPGAPLHNDDSVAWGEPSSGLRLGIGLGPVSPEPQLRLVFENMGKIEIPVLLGAMTGKGAVYNLTFRIKSSGGQESDLFNFNGPPGIAGNAQPIIAHIAKGQKYEILLSLKKFVALENGKNRTLPELLAAHYSVRAMLDTSGDPRQVRPLALWMGELASGDFKK
jgi:hypothetical protein